MIHKRKKKEKSESCFKFNAYCLSSKKNTVSNNSFSEKQKGGVNFKATWNLSTPFLALLSQVEVKQIYALFTWKIFVDEILLHRKFLSFVPLKQKKALWKLFSPEISQFFMTRS